jgi:hypothetical protein
MSIFRNNSKKKGEKISLLPSGIVVPKEYQPFVWDIHLTENNKNSKKIIYV